ncbi:MAG: 2-polyprenyl-6-methoxyphenol hydroxylase-related FAD-dependent oxidoreductase [Candidatus Nomurabacteria bacterium]|nr:2-polyprenyl-6-methoxyphenol hydroxylase-related FAD-dependent oxidoreductase [Candidatus Nomurabacteria bacterium]
MKILIVGAGIAGLTLASFLKEHEGFDVDIIDKAPDWSHLGFTIDIWDVGRRILARLDLDDDFDDLSHPVHSYYVADKKLNNRIVLEHFEKFYKKYPSVLSQINRKDVHAILIKKSECDIRMNLSIESVNDAGDKVLVTFSDKSIESYDLVVGADGIHSQIRELIYPDVKIEYTGDRGWFTWIAQKYVSPQTITEILGPNTMCSLFDNPNQACAFFTAKEIPGTFCDPSTRMDRLKKHFKDYGSPIPEILSELKAEDLMPTDIGFIKTDKWIKGRIIIIGDAAHAMEPFAGIGASMAMEDAYVLADELIQIQLKEIPKALEAYKKRRLPRIKLARHQTRLNYYTDVSKIPGLHFLERVLAPFFSTSHFTKGYARLLETEP